MSQHRKKARDLIRLALDEKTTEDERIAAALRAVKLIDKYDLLRSPIDGLLESDNETVSAAASIFERITDPELVRSIKTVSAGIKRVRGAGRRKRGD